MGSAPAANSINSNFRTILFAAPAESFRIMRYVSADGAESLRIWNSRAGMTPIGVSHPDTGTGLLHLDWTADIISDRYVPDVGEWIWADLTFARALEMSREFIATWWDHPTMPMREHEHYNPDDADGPEAIERAAHIHAMGATPGEPDLVQVTAEMRAEFEWKAAQR